MPECMSLNTFAGFNFVADLAHEPLDKAIQNQVNGVTGSGVLLTNMNRFRHQDLYL